MSGGMDHIAEPSSQLDIDLLAVERLDALFDKRKSARRSNILLAVSLALIVVGFFVIVEQRADLVDRNTEIQEKNEEVEKLSAELARVINGIDGEGADLERSVATAKDEAVSIEKRIESVLSPGVLATPPSEPVMETVVLTRGSLRGWDIDVFWCENQYGRENYGGARRIAAFLSNASAGQQQAAPGMLLGKVEIQPWKSDYNPRRTDGFTVVSDQGEGEDEARDALISFLEANHNYEFTKTKSSGDLTPYYLSVFACRQN